MRILVVGGAGYIGGVTARLLQQQKHRLTVLDNFSTGHRKNLPKGVKVIEGDIRKPRDLRAAFSSGRFEAVLHFAAKIRVDESIKRPFDYFDNNVTGSLNLLEAISANPVPFIFSSSAAVYGQPKNIPITETAAVKPISPYGVSKAMVEQLLASYQQTRGLPWVALRYFNPVGSYQGIGPDYPFRTHLVPVAIAALRRQQFTVHGSNCPTPDGSPVRDFVHVRDVAQAHVLAVKKLSQGQPLNKAINIGSGRGYSVLEVIKTLESLTHQPLKYKFGPRRPGDPAQLVASNRLAKRLLGWQPQASLKTMLKDALAWQSA